MKSRVLLLILVIGLIFLTGCGKKSEDNKVKKNKDSINIDEKLLKGYPKDILPIYKPIEVEDTKFTYRDDPSYAIGKDLYTISYISDAKIDDISDYYLSLMTKVENKEKEWFNKYNFDGSINNNNVIISMGKVYDNDNIRVSLTIGLQEKDYVDKNPFFDNYPNDLVDVYRKTKLQEITYKKDYFYKQEIYMTIFQTDMTEDEFLEYYKTKYENKENFKASKNTYNNNLTWDDRGYKIDLNYSKSGNYNFINIYTYLK